MITFMFDGEVNAKIQIQDYTNPLSNQPFTESYYNVYSVPQVRDYLKKLGYVNFQYTPFEIDIDLPKLTQKGMRTYTEKLEDGRRI